MLQITNLRRFTMSLQAQKAREQRRLTVAYRAFVTKVFQDLLLHSPQWSGQLVANWNILLTNESTAPMLHWYKKDHTGWAAKMPYKPAQRGDPEAATTAWDRAEAKIAAIRWNTKVTFFNADPNAEAIETNSMTPPLRPVNLVNGSVAMAAYIRQKYSRGEILLGA